MVSPHRTPQSSCDTSPHHTTPHHTMAENCGTTRGAGNNRAYEDAVNTRIDGDLQEVESDLPEDIRDSALSVFRAAISDKATVQQAIEKVQKEALVEVETRFKGQRFKVSVSSSETPSDIICFSSTPGVHKV